MTFVWLATSSEYPTGGEEDVLPALFADVGIDAQWAQWDDDDVDWARADLVAVRTTWDYTQRLDDFLAWADRVAGLTRLVNPPEVIRWNTDKRYLLQLPELGLAPVPTVVATGTDELAGVLAGRASAVVKPAVGVGGFGLELWTAGDPVPQVATPVVVQPVVDSVRTRGEVSVFVMGGVAVAQVGKRPVAGELRVHEHFGGTSSPEVMDAALAALAERAVLAVGDLFSTQLPYGRVDVVEHDGGWLVSELELTEPSLYVAVDPAIAAAYVNAIAGLAGRLPGQFAGQPGDRPPARSAAAPAE